MVGVYQGAGRLKSVTDYVPAAYRDEPTNPHFQGQFHSLLVLGPVDSPHSEGDEGWFCVESPGGAKATIHRVIHQWSPRTPIAPHTAYKLQGGMTLMAPADIDKFCQQMALEVLEAPGKPIFTNCPTPNLTQDDIRQLRSFSQSKREVRAPKHEKQFPAHDGLVSDDIPHPLGVVKRSDNHEHAPAECISLIKHAPSDNHGFPKDWPGPLSKIGNSLEVNYAKLPYPITKYAKLVPNALRLDFDLNYLKLTNTETKWSKCFGVRSSVTKGLARIKGYKVDSMIYALKYLKTVDAAAGEAKENYEVMLNINDVLHFPLACGIGMMALRNKKPEDYRVFYFTQLGKYEPLAGFTVGVGQCGCANVGSYPTTFYFQAGKYYKQNVAEMLKRLRAELGAPRDLAAYEFEFVKVEADSTKTASEGNWTATIPDADSEGDNEATATMTSAKIPQDSDSELSSLTVSSEDEFDAAFGTSEEKRSPPRDDCGEEFTLARQRLDEATQAVHRARSALQLALWEEEEAKREFAGEVAKRAQGL